MSEDNNSEYGQEQACNDFVSNVPGEKRICKTCGQSLSPTHNSLEHFITPQNTNLATTEPMIADEISSDSLSIDSFAEIYTSLSEIMFNHTDNYVPLNKIKKQNKQKKKHRPGKPKNETGPEKVSVGINCSLSMASSKSSKDHYSSEQNKKQGRDRKKKKLMQQSIVSSDDEKTEVDSDFNNDDSVNSTKLRREQKKKAPKRKKEGCVYERTQIKKKNTLTEMKDMPNASDTETDVSTEPKTDLPFKEKQCWEVKISPHKKKKPSDKFHYVIESSSPLPYGKYTITVDNISIIQSDSSADNVSTCSCDECKASTSVGKKKRKMCSNNKDFVRKYKNENAGKRASRNRRGRR